MTPQSPHRTRALAKAQETCHGLADAMLGQLEKSRYDLVTEAANNKGQPFLLLQDIAIAGKRGYNKILAASSLALYGINAARHQAGLTPANAGFHQSGDAWQAWFTPDALDGITAADARRAMEKLKDRVKEGPDLHAQYGDFPRRDNGSYWVGPIRRSDHLTQGFVTMLITFHGTPEIPTQAYDMHDGTMMIDCDRAGMLDLLGREKILAKGRGA